jgi:hypothetical protein
VSGKKKNYNVRNRMDLAVYTVVFLLNVICGKQIRAALQGVLKKVLILFWAIIRIQRLYAYDKFIT